MITPKLLRAWGACWDDERIAAAFGSRTEVTPRDVAAATNVSLGDRLWVLSRCLGYLDESAARAFAVESAATAARRVGDEDDQAQYLGLLNSLLEIEDLPEDQRTARRRAARDAAWGAACDAARDAACDAACGAAWGAARDAARDAAWGAARDAARDAALRSAVDRAISWLGDYADGWEE